MRLAGLLAHVGAHRAFEDPEAALRARAGAYGDPTARLTPGQRYPELPRAPDPYPFRELRDIGPGARGGR